MRLAELFEPQVPTRKRNPRDTVPEVFIIESLELSDEAKERREGAVLAAVLKMCGKNPLYYYIRTKAELKLMAKEFTASGYRYLHVSCHGTEGALETTVDSVSYREFAAIFRGRLRNRRLFVSACSAGNERFAEIVGARNPQLNSVAAPAVDIRFDHAVALWSSFYVKLFSSNSTSMSSGNISEAFTALSELFDVPIHWTRRDKRKGWDHQTLYGTEVHTPERRRRAAR